MSNFWQKHAGSQPSTGRSSDVPLAPSQRPMTTYQQPQQARPNRPMESIDNGGKCPSCRSGNYMKVGSVATQYGNQDAWRCYDCGYPKVQSGSGTGGVSVPSAGPTQKAVQVPTGGWNPQGIIGKLE